MMEGLEDPYEEEVITYGRIIGTFKDKPIYDRIFVNNRPLEYIGVTDQPPKYVGDVVLAPGILYRPYVLNKEK